MAYVFKKCDLCSIKIDEEFVLNFKPKEYSSIHGFCRDCRRKLRKLQLKLGGKVCTKCSISKPFGDFPFHKKTYDGFDSWCKICRREYKYEAKQSLDTFFRASLSRIRDDRRKIPSSLTIQNLIDLWNKQNGKCAISGHEMTYQRTKRVHNLYNCSIDRIDSAKDYNINNVQLVCWAVNRMKGEQPQHELLNWCKLILKHNNITLDK